LKLKIIFQSYITWQDKAKARQRQVKAQGIAWHIASQHTSHYVVYLFFLFSAAIFSYFFISLFSERMIFNSFSNSFYFHFAFSFFYALFLPFFPNFFLIFANTIVESHQYCYHQSYCITGWYQREHSSCIALYYIPSYIH